MKLHLETELLLTELVLSLKWLQDWSGYCEVFKGHQWCVSVIDQCFLTQGSRPTNDLYVCFDSHRQHGKILNSNIPGNLPYMHA